MTDARFPDRWLSDRRFRRLSDGEYRSYSQALMWAVLNRTDGDVPAKDLAIIPDFVPDHAGRLVEVELWAPAGAGWLILDFGATQTSKEQLDGLDARKRQDADRQKAKRDRDKRAASSPGHHVKESRDGHVTESRDDIGQGQGQGQPLQEEEAGALPESSNIRGPSSMESVFCHGCGQELDDWTSGTVAGHCLGCSAGCSACSAGPEAAALPGPVAADLPAADPGGCSVAGCGGVVTDYLRRTYGQVCLAHVGAVAS
ncbi:hypothetical protein [Arthrobacter sp. ISL-69]|uniref:hypothetical protein n=1 Tax=Arthrobacter sp. ISL-69 TaxID=2819113 RepID=UPI001BED1563|nr:hypothetical protein [Arthrobacter sp. ISL-69]MBT2535886.1 hypothetical protein [Arthrobacter sp. ISL-69]